MKYWSALCMLMPWCWSTRPSASTMLIQYLTNHNSFIKKKCYLWDQNILCMQKFSSTRGNSSRVRFCLRCNVLKLQCMCKCHFSRLHEVNHLYKGKTSISTRYTCNMRMSPYWIWPINTTAVDKLLTGWSMIIFWLCNITYRLKHDYFLVLW